MARSYPEVEHLRVPGITVCVITATAPPFAASRATSWRVCPTGM